MCNVEWGWLGCCLGHVRARATCSATSVRMCETSPAAGVPPVGDPCWLPSAHPPLRSLLRALSFDSSTSNARINSPSSLAILWPGRGSEVTKIPPAFLLSPCGLRGAGGVWEWVNPTHYRPLEASWAARKKQGAGLANIASRDRHRAQPLARRQKQPPGNCCRPVDFGRPAVSGNESFPDTTGLPKPAGQHGKSGGWAEEGLLY